MKVQDICVKLGKNLIFLKNGKNSKIAEMVQGSLEFFSRSRDFVVGFVSRNLVT